MELKNKKILMFVQDEYEDLELQYPRYRLLEAGAKVIVAGPEAGHVYKGKHGYPCKADEAIKNIQAEDFHGLVIPGGYAPDKLRTDQKVLDITKKLHEKQKLIAYICHAGWIPVSAGIIKGIKCTSYIAIRDDMVNAGANWIDEPVVVDGHIISSRCPDDLPVFCPAIIKFLSSQ